MQQVHGVQVAFAKRLLKKNTMRLLKGKKGVTEFLLLTCVEVRARRSAYPLGTVGGGRGRRRKLYDRWYTVHDRGHVDNTIASRAQNVNGILFLWDWNHLSEDSNLDKCSV